MSEAIERRLRALGEELAVAVGNATGAAVTLAAGDAAHDQGWIVTLTATGPHAGRLCVLLDGAATTRLAGRLLGDQGIADDKAIATVLHEVISRAAAALSARAAEERLALVVDGVEPRTGGEGSGEGVALAFALNGLGAPIPVSLTWMQSAVATTASSRTPPASEAVGTAAPGRLDVILDIDLPVVVRFGSTQMPIRALARLGPGSVIELGRSPDDPVEVLVSNRVVARGEVVIVGGNYGVRILDVTSQSERARSMEGK